MASLPNSEAIWRNREVISSSAWSQEMRSKASVAAGDSPASPFGRTRRMG